MGFSREEYWSGLSFPPLGDLPDPGMEPVSLASPALAGGFFTTRADIAILNTKAMKEREKERQREEPFLGYCPAHLRSGGSLIHSGP